MYTAIYAITKLQKLLIVITITAEMKDVVKASSLYGGRGSGLLVSENISQTLVTFYIQAKLIPFFQTIWMRSLLSYVILIVFVYRVYTDTFQMEVDHLSFNQRKRKK